MSVKDLIDKLRKNAEGCEDKVLELSQLTLEEKEGDICLCNGPFSYYFRTDPKNPKSPKVIHAARQFCKILGVPFSFFFKNPSAMKKHMVECWLPSLKPEKSVVLAKLRTIKDHVVLRAILPAEFTNISNVEVMERVAEAAGECFRTEFVIGDDSDDLILHVRFVSNETFEAYGESCSLGFSVIASELGECPLAVDTLLFRNVSKTSMLATYGTESFFRNEYVNIQPNDLKGLFPQMMDNLKSQLPYIRTKIQAAKEMQEKKTELQNLLRDLRMVKGLPERFHVQLSQELKDTSVISRWELSDKVAAIAKNFDIQKRMKIEAAAGHLVGLSFAKA
jgi:hypothetical protein